MVSSPLGICKKVTLVNRSVEKAQEVLEDDMVSRTAILNLAFGTGLWNLVVSLHSLALVLDPSCTTFGS